MEKAELKNKILRIARKTYKKVSKVEESSSKFLEIQKFPELKRVIESLLSEDFENFISSIDWVAPKPSTFRINLKNNRYFYLMFGKRSWMAQVAGKKYYLRNYSEEQRATEALSYILRYKHTDPNTEEAEDTSSSSSSSGGSSSSSSSGGSGGSSSWDGGGDASLDSDDSADTSTDTGDTGTTPEIDSTPDIEV